MKAAGTLLLALCACGNVRAPVSAAQDLARADGRWAQRLAPSPGAWQRTAGWWTNPRGPLAAHLPDQGAEALELSFGARRLTLTPVDARDARLEDVSGRAVYRDLWAATDVVWTADEAGLESFLLLRGEEAPRTFAWRVDAPGWSSTVVGDQHGGLLFLDSARAPRLRVVAPRAVDAQGTPRAAALSYAEGTLSVSLDTAGLRFPILLDPSFETTVWTVGPAGPPERGFAALAADERGRLVLFGGTQPDGFGSCAGASPDLDDTWEYADGGWVALSPMTRPSARNGHAMAAAGGGRTLLFGGSSGPGETWEWDGATWTQRTTPGPPARCSHAMAFDRSRGRVVLFGGNAGCMGTLAPLGDTWEWDGTSWRELAIDAGPPARMGHAMAFDLARRRTVLFGGFGLQPSGFGETWEWDGVAWQLVAPADAGPGARASLGFAHDSATGKTLLFGGGRSCNRQRCACQCTYAADTWAWDGVEWTQLGTTGAPGRLGPAVAFDPARRRTVSFGGVTDDCCCGYAYGDTFELLTHGNTCATDADCDTFHCVDGACCDVASCGVCQACALRTGACAVVTNRPDPDSCPGLNTCDSAGACVPALNLPNGTPCAAGAMCSSGVCADGVCCERACDGQCEACVGDGGTCVVVAGEPVGARAPCGGDGGVCAPRCDGRSPACSVAGSAVTCGLACLAGQTQRSQCSGAGQCGPPRLEACSVAACGACDGPCSDCDAGCVSCADGGGRCDEPGCPREGSAWGAGAPLQRRRPRGWCWRWSPSDDVEPFERTQGCVDAARERRDEALAVLLTRHLVIPGAPMPRITNRPQTTTRTPQTQGRYATPQARMEAIKGKALTLIAGGKLEFTGKAPKKTDIARQFEVKNARPFTYTAIELKSGEVVLKKVLTGGFVPARPGDGAYTAPMKFDELARS